MRSLFLLLVAAGSIAYAKPLPEDGEYNEIADAYTIPAETIPADEEYTNNDSTGDGYVDTKEPSILGLNNDGSTNDRILAAANTKQDPYCNSTRSRFTKKIMLISSR